MKIVHVTEAWQGGIASYTKALINWQVNNGYNVSLLVSEKADISDMHENNFNIYRYFTSRDPKKLISISKKLKELIINLSPDIIHCHSTFPGLYVRMLNHNAKIVYTPHCWSFLMNDIGPLKKWIYSKVEKVLSKRTDSIICMSFEEISAAKQVGIQPNVMKLVHTGIPDVALASKPIRLTTNNSSLVVGFFGRFDTQKGFDILDQAIDSFPSNIECHLFGDFVRGQSKELNSKFIHHGWIDHKDIHKYMSSVDVIVIPSRWEGFALTPLEAMRASKPVVISNESSLPEVVIHNFNGIVMSDFSSNALVDAIHLLTRAQCENLGQNGRIVYESTFSFEMFAAKVLECYQA
jgi:glycosyltransferase involved in cell wall biosynthesis